MCGLLISDLSLMRVHFAYLNLNQTFYDKHINICVIEVITAIDY